MSNAIRWALVNFCGCITCGVLGHYLPVDAAIFSVSVAALIVSFLGGITLDTERP